MKKILLICFLVLISVSCKKKKKKEAPVSNDCIGVCGTAPVIPPTQMPEIILNAFTCDTQDAHNVEQNDFNLVEGLSFPSSGEAISPNTKVLSVTFTQSVEANSVLTSTALSKDSTVLLCENSSGAICENTIMIETKVSEDGYSLDILLNYENLQPNKEYRIRASPAIKSVFNQNLGCQNDIIFKTANQDISEKKTYYLDWYIPTQRENGDYLELWEIGGYEIRYRIKGQNQFTYVVIEDGSADETTISVPTVGDYEFEIATFDTNGLYSRFVKVNEE